MKKLALTSVLVSGDILSAFAQGQVNGSQLFSLLNVAQGLVNKVTPILVTVALLGFFLVFNKIYNSGWTECYSKRRFI